jgi:hypothetical protein
LDADHPEKGVLIPRRFTSLRDLFELNGEQVITLALALGAAQTSSGIGGGMIKPTHAMMLMDANEDAARDRLREKREIAECHATRIEILEWAILVFVVLGTISETATLLR